MLPHIDDPRLRTVAEKVEAAERLDYDDGLALYRSPDLLTVGYLANHRREKLNGNITYFNVNRHINPTDVCVAACKLCAFGKQVRDPRAYTMSLEQVWHVAGQGYTEAVSEFHIVGGLHPELTLDWYCEMIGGLRERYPQVHLKVFTMVEIGYLARRAKISVEETLRRLKGAGVQSLPGGGAEIFHERVRRIICDHKINGEEWLATARTAHKMGLRSNATMLYGHIETEEDRVGPPTEVAGFTGRDRRLPDIHPARVSPGKHVDAPSAGDERVRGHQEYRHCQAAARQLPAHQSVLDHDDAENRPGCPTLRR